MCVSNGCVSNSLLVIWPREKKSSSPKPVSVTLFVWRWVDTRTNIPAFPWGVAVCDAL